MYIVIKTIKGRQYRYAQWSWREGRRVRTKSRSLGPVGAALRSVGKLIEANRTRRYGYDEDLALKQYNERSERDNRERQAHLAQLHAKCGLKLPEAPIPVAPPIAPAGNISPSKGTETASPCQASDAPPAAAHGGS